MRAKGVIFPDGLSNTGDPANGPTSVDYLVVAGGGAGGGSTGLGAGGGAGGFQTGSGLSITIGTPYAVTVGAGGVDSGNNNAGKGSNSVFSSVVSIGGGQGSEAGAPSGYNGGSGGGGSYNPVAGRPGGSGTPGQGNNGGTGYTGFEI